MPRAGHFSAGSSHDQGYSQGVRFFTGFFSAHSAGSPRYSARQNLMPARLTVTALSRRTSLILHSSQQNLVASCSEKGLKNGTLRGER